MNTEREVLIEYAQAAKAEFTPAFSQSTSNKDTIVFTHEQLFKFSQLQTAALQKRIEELEARDVGLATIERLKAVLSRAGYSTDESLETFAARLETHIYSLCQYAESKLDSIKAGDVQAPKEEFKVVSIEFLKRLHNALFAENPFAEKETKELCALIAAAPTDKEGK